MSDDRIRQYILAASEDQAIADVGVYDDPCQVYCIGATVGVALVLADWIESDKVKDARIASLQARYLQAINLMGAAVIDRSHAVEALRQALSVCLSIRTSPDRHISSNDGVGYFWQTEEWCAWAQNEIAPMLASVIKTADAEIDHNAEFERIQTAAKRYETLRTLNPRQFADLYAKNLETGTPFDELVDGLARGDL